MTPSYGHLFLTIMKWRLIAERDRQETEEYQHQQNTQAPAPMCLQRKADLMAGMDDMGQAAGRVAAQFTTKEKA